MSRRRRARTPVPAPSKAPHLVPIPLGIDPRRDLPWRGGRHQSRSRTPPPARRAPPPPPPPPPPRPVGARAPGTPTAIKSTAPRPSPVPKRGTVIILEDDVMAVEDR